MAKAEARLTSDALLRDRARQRFTHRPSRRPRRRGVYPVRRRTFPPRHRGEGVL